MNEATQKLQGKAAGFARLLRDHLPALREHYGVKSFGLFGSYVRGEERKGSGLELLVEFVALGRELSELLGVTVDLVMKRALKPRIGERILGEVVVV